MQFLCYSVDDEATDQPPTPELMAEMGKFVQEARDLGVLLATGGLGAGSTRIRKTGDKVAVTDGPFTEAKELTGGFALIDVKSRDEAVEWAKRFRDLVGDGESIVQEVFGG